jgi:D-alanine-D-alanine ligase
MVTVAVLRGGAGGEHEVSLDTGAHVLKVLPAVAEGRFRPLDVFIDKNGAWHVRGVPVSPERALANADVVFNALHGGEGEDGTVQRILERASIPYTGSGAFASLASLNKRLAKDMLVKAGAKVPRAIVLKVSPDLEREAMEAFRAFSPPVVVKPVSSGSSVGAGLAGTFAEFWEKVKEAFTHGKEVLVEEYLVGREATAGVIDDLRGQEHYALLPAEIAKPSMFSIFDYAAKQDGTRVRTSGGFTKEENAEIERIALLAHQALGLRHYSRSDFIVTPRGVYFLEANALPPLAPFSAFSQSLSATGISEEELFEHLIALALSEKRSHA